MAKVKTNIGHRHVRTLTLDEFRGVDFTSSVLDADKRRAVSMKNLLPEAGRNVKRPGWVQIHRLEGRIHGMWTFTHGETEELLVHAGSGLYEVYEEGGVSKYRAVKGCTELLGNGDSEAFFYGGRMYLVGHKSYLVYGSWDGGETYELREVAENEDTYIPTTTIAINPDGETDEAGNVKDTRVSLEPVNRLTSKRKNRMMGKSLGEAQQIRWRMDSDVTLSLETLGDISVQVSVLVKNGTYKAEKTYELVADTASFDEVGADHCNLKLIGDVVPEGYETGDYAGTLLQNGELWLSFDTTPPLEDEDNITVTFVKATEGHAESIGKCRFGVLYGAGGNADRLFLSGNPDTPEVEYYSYWRDPTYFPDNHYNRVGTSYSAVTGFTRVSDGVLAAFKEGDRQEPTVYYHTATEEEIYNKADELQRVDFILTTQAGNIGEAIISRRASVDFFGDPLILSENGVFGIVMRQNLMTADRYAAERSRNIREKLRQVRAATVSGKAARTQPAAPTGNAFGLVFENKYWLFTGGVCFVADEGYTYRPKESPSGYQYEWWYLENIPAVSGAVMGGHLWFGTEDGRVCRFRRADEGGAYRYTDESFQFFSPWASPGVIQDVESLTVRADDFTRIVASESFISKLGNASMDTLVLSSDTYARYLNADEMTVENHRIFLNDPDRIRDIREGAVVYSDGLGGMGISEQTPLTVKDIDRGEGSFALANASGILVQLLIPTKLALKLTGRELFISDVDSAACTFSLKLYQEGNALEMVKYGAAGLIADFHGRHTSRDVVVSEWYTPVIDLGTPAYAKTLERMTIAMEPMEGGAASVGYDTRLACRASDSLVQKGADLTDLSFRDFTLSAFAASDTVLCRERNINYIRFRVVSDKPQDMRVHGITAEYKITTANRGLQ